METWMKNADCQPVCKSEAAAKNGEESADARRMILTDIVLKVTAVAKARTATLSNERT